MTPSELISTLSLICSEPENMKNITDAQKQLEVITDKLNKVRVKREKLQDFKGNRFVNILSVGRMILLICADEWHK